MAHGIEAVKRVKKHEMQDQQAGLLAPPTVPKKIANVFNTYAGFVNNSGVSVWNNQESSSASSQL